MSYFIFQPDPRVPEQPSVLACPQDIAPEEFLMGKSMSVPRNPLRLKMSERSGKFRGAIITGVLTLFHNRLRDELKKLGVDNLEYFPVDLENPEGQVEQKYSLINIVGLLDAVDQANSVIVPRATGGRGDLKSFKIDPAKTQGLRMFRIPEAPSMIIIDETLQADLTRIEPAGAWMLPTDQYDGWGW
jgi:hypothetical protein